MAKEIKKKASKTRVLPRIIYATSFIAALGLGTIFLFMGDFGTKQDAGASVTVYKSPTCGCCGAWVNHVEENGFNVHVVNHQDVSAYKQKLGVPEHLYSCHTAVVDEYVIEGHVTASDIKRLLREKRSVRGLSVPGMPHGSPGMETGRVDHYKVLAFDEHQNTHVFNSY